MVSASGPEAAFTIVARDRALKLISVLNERLGSTVSTFGQLTRAVLRASAVFQLFALAIPIVAGALVGLIAATTIPDMISLAVATRRARIQLQFMGLDAINATAAVDALSASLDRATATSLLQNADAIAGVALAGADLAVSLGLLAKELATVTGLDTTEVFNALIQARLFDNVEPLLRLVGAMTGLGVSLGDLSDKSPEEIINLLMELLSKENVTNAEGLAAAMERLSVLTLPLKETVSEFVIAFLLVFTNSLEERITNFKGNFEEIMLGALAGAMIGSGRGLGGILAGAILGSLGVTLTLEFNNTMKEVFENPLLTANIIAVAATLGKVAGKGLVTGLILAAGVALLPGLKAEFDKLATSDQVFLSVFTLATALGVFFKLRFIIAIGLGGALAQAAKDLISGRDGGATRVSFGVAGSALGVLFGRSFVGGLVGFFAGTLLFDLVKDTAWFRSIHFVFAIIENIADNALAAVARSIAFVFQAVLKSIVDTINFVIQDINRVVEAINKLPGPNIPAIPTIPDFKIPSFFDTTPRAFPTFRQAPVPSLSPGDPGFIGPIPGGLSPFPGAPSPGLQGPQQPIQITLMLDKKIIGEVSVDAVRREWKFKAGIIPGFSL